MNIIKILGMSLIIFIGFRILFISLYSILKKIITKSTENMTFDLLLSLGFCLIYLEAFVSTAQGISNNNELSNVEWYFVYTFIGVSLMIWSYFSWELSWKAKPQFAREKTQMAMKKIIVFIIVMAFSFYQGYTQLYENFGGGFDEEKNLLVSLTNITIIPGIIALDRVLNQISILLSEKKK